MILTSYMRILLPVMMMKRMYKISSFYCYTKTGDFLQIGRRCREKRTLNKANMKIFKLYSFSLLQLVVLSSCDICGKLFLLVYY